MSKLEELIKEFCPNGVEYISVEELLKEKTISSITPSLKIKRNDYKDFGEIPIISQEEEYISGCCNIFDKKIIDGQYVCFGDHTENVKYVDFRFVQGADGLKIICCNNKEKIDIKYFYYAVCNFYKRHNNYERHYKYFVELQIPLPTLPVQREIVRVLDSFTLYSAELTARRKQYEFYRDKLLMPKSSTYQTEWKELKDVCRLVTGATPSTSKKEYWENGTIPWMSSGEVNNKRIFYTEEKITELGYQSSSTTLVPIHSVVIALAGQGKTRGKVAITEIELCTNQSLCSLICGTSMNYKFLYYYLDGKYEELRAISNGDGTRGGLSLRLLAPYKIPVPPMEVQERIVKVLDNFDAICSDLGIGLPAEIEKRQKQYEYYREKLLTFDGKYATILTERNGTERNGQG